MSVALIMEELQELDLGRSTCKFEKKKGEPTIHC